MAEFFLVFFAVIGFAVTATVTTALTVKMSSTKTKLRIIRYGAILAATAGIAFDIKGLRYPLMWLRHYLLGSGKALRVPTHLLTEAKSALVRAIIYGDSYSSSHFGKYHCLDHSTLYEGSGFYNRPSLFYLVGGFTFLLRKDGKISGKDIYDWHPTESGEYFTSPLGTPVAVAILNWIFGNGWFVNVGFPCGESGISNKLWADMELVGARPFQSYFCNESVFDDIDLMQINTDTVFTGIKMVSKLDVYTMRQQGINIDADAIALVNTEYCVYSLSGNTDKGYTLTELYLYRNYQIDFNLS